jgi:pre-mRNA-processing factor 40
LELEASPWKEYKTPEGKKYYHNSATSTTVWTAPEEYQAILDQLEEEQKTLAAQAAASSSQQPASPTTPSTPLKPPTPLMSSSSTVSTPSPLRQQTNINGMQTIASPVAPLPQLHMNGSVPPFMPLPHNGPMTARPPFGHPPPPHHQHQQQPGGSRPPPRFQQSFVPPAGDRDRDRSRGHNNNANETPEFHTKEEAEQAFKNLLKETVRKEVIYHFTTNRRNVLFILDLI